MSDSQRVVVEEALSAWRAAERALEGLPPGDPAIADRRAEVDRLRDQYQRAVLSSRGRVDQLEAAAEGSQNRLKASGLRRDESQRTLRRT